MRTSKLWQCKGGFRGGKEFLDGRSLEDFHRSGGEGEFVEVCRLDPFDLGAGDGFGFAEKKFLTRTAQPFVPDTFS